MTSLKFKFSPKIITLLILEWVSFTLRVKTGIEIFFFIFIFLALLLCIDLLLLAFNFIYFILGKKITIVRKVQEKITEGDSLSLRIFIYNQRYLPILNLVITDFLGCDSKNHNRQFFFEWLKPKSKQTLEYKCLCSKRGRYDIGPIREVFSGLIGFFVIEKIYGLKTQIYVYPRTFNIKETPPLTRGRLPWFGLETTAISGDSHEFFGVREYRAGDSVKRVHWLSTAKKNALIVKEFERVSFHQVSIVFVLNKDTNLGLGRESVCEYMIRIAASLAKYFTEKNICLEILAHTGKVVYFPSNRGAGYLEELFRFFAGANIESKIRLGNFLQENSKWILSDTTVFVLLTDEDIDSALQVLSLRDRHISVIALVLLSSSFKPGMITKKESNALKERITKRLSVAQSKVLIFSKGDDLSASFSRRG